MYNFKTAKFEKRSAFNMEVLRGELDLRERAEKGVLRVEKDGYKQFEHSILEVYKIVSEI